MALLPVSPAIASAHMGMETALRARPEAPRRAAAPAATRVYEADYSEILVERLPYETGFLAHLLGQVRNESSTSPAAGQAYAAAAGNLGVHLGRKLDTDA